MLGQALMVMALTLQLVVLRRVVILVLEVEVIKIMTMLRVL